MDTHLMEIKKQYQKLEQRFDSANAEYKAGIDNLEGNDTLCLSSKIKIYEKWLKFVLNQNNNFMNLSKELEINCIKSMMTVNDYCCAEIQSETEVTETEEPLDSMKRSLEPLEINKQYVNDLTKSFAKKIFSEKYDSDSAIDSFSSDVDDK